jgi:large subunit ribosomal protein L4
MLYKIKKVSITGDNEGIMDINDPLFNSPVNKNIIARVIHWQLAKKRSGCHSTKALWAINGSTKKIFAQKGRGQGRVGHAHAPQRRGGYQAMAPHYHSHEYDLNKKVKKLGLLMSVIDKLKGNNVFVISSHDFDSGKTKTIRDFMIKTGSKKPLFVGMSKEIQKNILLGARNLEKCDFLPYIGLNVYSVIDSDCLFFFEGAFDMSIGKMNIHSNTQISDNNEEKDKVEGN